MDYPDNENIQYDCNRGCAVTSTDTAELNCTYRQGCCKLKDYNWLGGIGQEQFKDLYEVRFKNTRKGFYINASNQSIKTGDLVIVEANGGHDLGIVTLEGPVLGRQMRRKGIDPEKEPFKKIYRKAKAFDIEKWQEAIGREHETMIQARKIATDMGLEMKQIGARQEAGLIGGLGVCGRELCCANYITNFQSITTSSARCQDLPLNPQKLAGQCGKLKCCLNNEVATYLDAQSRIPKSFDYLEFEDGFAYLMKTDILKETMYFSYDKSSIVELFPIEASQVKEILRMNRAGKKPASLKKDIEPVAPEFVTAVGDDSISRFDNVGRKKFHNKNNKRKNHNANVRFQKQKENENS